MAVFRETLILSQICQINVLLKCDENCLKSIPKQNLMKNMSLEEQKKDKRFVIVLSHMLTCFR